MKPAHCWRMSRQGTVRSPSLRWRPGPDPGKYWSGVMVAKIA